MQQNWRYFLDNKTEYWIVRWSSLIQFCIERNMVNLYYQISDTFLLSYNSLHIFASGLFSSLIFQVLRIATKLNSVVKYLHNVYHYSGFVMEILIVMMVVMSHKTCAWMLVHVEAIFHLLMALFIPTHTQIITHPIQTAFTESRSPIGQSSLWSLSAWI